MKDVKEEVEEDERYKESAAKKKEDNRLLKDAEEKFEET